MIRRAIRSLLNLDDPPERTALAFAVGVFIGFSPLLGLHTILAALIALVWRCNKVAIFTGIYVNNPWTLAPVVAASWAIGRLFIHVPHTALPDFSFGALVSAAFWQMLAAQWRQLLPFAIGATILSILSAATAYPLMLYTLRAYRRRQAGTLAPVSGKN
jgi:uncharacterized protein (DUF2062 family)